MHVECHQVVPRLEGGIQVVSRGLHGSNVRWPEGEMKCHSKQGPCPEDNHSRGSADKQ